MCRRLRAATFVPRVVAALAAAPATLVPLYLTSPTTQPIYLDNNATTRPTQAVVDAVQRGLTEYWHNPSSVHRAGQSARQQVELARRALAELIGAKPREVVLTSGGTEALDLVIRGVLASRRHVPGVKPLIVTTKVEHAAVRDLAEDLEKRGEAGVRWLALAEDGSGVVDAARLAEQITPEAALVVVQWANNETGAVQPVAAVCAAAQKAGVPCVVDGVQWVGKEPVDVWAGGAEPMCDALVFSPHKFHGPKGVGVLWVRPGLKFRPTVLGTQEMGRRGGTENVPGILGAGVAARETMEWLKDGSERARLGALRDRFEQHVLGAALSAGVNGAVGAGRLWNTTNIAFPRLEAEALLLLLSERGVCASAGAACSSGSLDPSPVLLAMGVPEHMAHGSVRFSLSRFTTREEVDAAATIVAECVRRLGGSMLTSA